MATVTYTQLNQRRDQAMRRTAPPIAKRAAALQDGEGRHQSAPQPSRLQQMQANYQRRLTKEKEDKLIAIHQRRQDQAELALQRVKGSDNLPGRSAEKKGVLREFFKERRQMDKKGRLDRLPPDSHLQKMRSDQRTLFEQEQQKQNELRKYANRQKQSQIQPPDKKQGYSKSKPLAPIKHERSIENSNHRPPLPESHYETAESLISDEDEDDSQAVSAVLLSKPKRVPVGLQGKSNSDGVIVSRQHVKPKRLHDTNRNVINATPPRKPLPQVKPGKKRTTPVHDQIERKQQESNEPSDFQKFQMEQDKQRDARLRKYEEKLAEERKTKPAAFDMSRDDDEFEGEKYYNRVDRNDAQSRRRHEYDDMMDKEKELEAMIHKHQEELEKLQTKDSSDEEAAAPDNTLPPHRARPVQRNKPTVKKATGKREPTIRKDPTDEYERYEDRYGYYQEEERPFNSVDVDSYQEEDFRNARNTESVNGKQRYTESLDRHDQSHTNKAYDQDKGTSFYAQVANDEADQTSGLDLRPCQICGRKFAADRLPKHKQICKKSSNKKRKVFDISKQRMGGTDMSQFVKRGDHHKEPTKKSGSNWRKKHEDFIRAVRDARTVQAHIAKGGKVSDLPPPPPSENPDYKQCPYCKRKFSPSAADRHISHCKNTKNRPKPPPNRRP